MRRILGYVLQGSVMSRVLGGPCGIVISVRLVVTLGGMAIWCGGVGMVAFDVKSGGLFSECFQRPWVCWGLRGQFSFVLGCCPPKVWVCLHSEYYVRNPSLFYFIWGDRGNSGGVMGLNYFTRGHRSCSDSSLYHLSSFHS
jgi:hypothetical protein